MLHADLEDRAIRLHGPLPAPAAVSRTGTHSRAGKDACLGIDSHQLFLQRGQLRVSGLARFHELGA